MKKLIILFLFISASFLFAVDKLDPESIISPEDIKKAVDKADLDVITVAHLDETFAKINAVLSAQLQMRK